MKRHVNQTDLALYASGDLSLWQSAKVRFHVGQCMLCRECADGFRADAKTLRDTAALMPEGLDWDRLSAEMSANIRVGLAAGECVAPRRSRKTSAFTIPMAWRPTVLASGVAAMLTCLLVGAWWLNVPAQDTQALNRAMHSVWRGHAAGHGEDRGAVIEASSDGIEFRKDGASLSVSQDSARLVTVSVSTQGSASAHYVDQDTGQVTVTSVYAQ